jgi:hypothetical protein|tara:strand:- start:1074 stop:1316 length:243 start_codon:yes stop_codon:yes gene_type:complete
MNIYEINHKSVCPNNGNVDYYDITITSSFVIQVEEIIESLNSMPTSIYQEEIADKLSETFAATVQVVGFHQKVKITSTRK